MVAAAKNLKIGWIFALDRTLIASGLLAVLIFVSPPLFFVQRYSLTNINKIVIVAVTVLLLALLVRRLTIDTTTAQIGLLQLIQATTILVLPFVHSMFGYAFDSGYLNLAFQILTCLALYLIFASAKKLNVLANFWVNLHLVIGACGLIVFAAGVIVNLEPLTTFLERPYYDFGLAYTNVFYQVGGMKLIRVAGFYDEPGTFAFYMTFALLIARVFAMPRWKEAALVVFGLASLSMAFMVVVFFWLLFAKLRSHLPYTLALATVLSFSLWQADPEVREMVYRVTVDRFSISSSDVRILRGDSRTPRMIANYRAFGDAPVIGHGIQYEDYVGDRYQYSFIVNPAAPFATHGALGAFFINLHVLVFVVVLFVTRALRPRDRAFVLCVLLATLAQRPITINGLGYLLFIIMLHETLREAPLLQIFARARA